MLVLSFADLPDTKHYKKLAKHQHLAVITCEKCGWQPRPMRVLKSGVKPSWPRRLSNPYWVYSSVIRASGHVCKVKKSNG